MFHRLETAKDGTNILVPIHGQTRCHGNGEMQVINYIGNGQLVYDAEALMHCAMSIQCRCHVYLRNSRNLRHITKETRQEMYI
jgi:hypothetical protein